MSVKFHHAVVDLAILVINNAFGGQRGAHVERHWRDSLKVVFVRSGQVHRETVLLVSRGLLEDRVRTDLRLLLLVHICMVRCLGCVEAAAVAHIQLAFAHVGELVAATTSRVARLCSLDSTILLHSRDA